MSNEFKRSEKLMGNNFEITVVGPSREWAEDKINLAVAEIKRIEALLSTFRCDSVTNEINNNAGERPVVVTAEVYNLITRAVRISEITDGAFDLSYGSLDKRLWNFDCQMTSLPDKQLAKDAVRLINFKNIVLDQQSSGVMLKEKGMRIGFGGIGKGYAAERARALLKSAGVVGGIVNASGDLATWGQRASGKPWTVGISHPDLAAFPFSHLEVSDSAIATSGNYEKYVMINNVKYSHTINPKTGFPVTGIKSVTIFCTNAELADALTTPVTIMGVRAGINLVNQLAGIECIMIDDRNTIYTSENINLT